MKLFPIIIILILTGAVPLWADDEGMDPVLEKKVQDKEGFLKKEIPPPVSEELPEKYKEERARLLKKNFTLEANLKLHGQGYIQNGEEGARLSGSTVSVIAKYKDLIRAVVTGKLDREIYADGEIQNPEMTIEDFLKEAYIEIHNIGGQPVAFIFGKQNMAFSQQFFPMPFWVDGALYNLQVKNQVIGLTVRMDKQTLLNIFDKAELSWFENKPKDLSIGTMDGISLRLTKQLLKELQLTLSSFYAGNDYLPQEFHGETRQAVGLIYKNKADTVNVYAEGMYFEHNQKYPNSDFGLTAGVVFRVDKITTVNLEYSLINDYLQQFAVAYRIALTKNISFAPEIMYWKYNHETAKNQDHFLYGIDLTVLMDTKENSYYKNYLFGKKQ
jgi:hypothetical protein